MNIFLYTQYPTRKHWMASQRVLATRTAHSQIVCPDFSSSYSHFVSPEMAVGEKVLQRPRREEEKSEKSIKVPQQWIKLTVWWVHPLISHACLLIFTFPCNLIIKSIVRRVDNDDIVGMFAVCILDDVAVSAKFLTFVVIDCLYSEFPPDLSLLPPLQVKQLHNIEIHVFISSVYPEWTLQVLRAH